MHVHVHVHDHSRRSSFFSPGHPPKKGHVAWYSSHDEGADAQTVAYAVMSRTADRASASTRGATCGGQVLPSLPCSQASSGQSRKERSSDIDMLLRW